MLETYNLMLTNAYRNLKKNIEQSPGLYFIFSLMMVFSVAMMTGLSMFFLNSEIYVNLDDLFFMVFFVFMIKAVYDFYRYFTNSPEIVYSLSSSVNHVKTGFEIFLTVFWIQLGLWALFSILYTVFLLMAGARSYDHVNFVYLQYTLGIVLSSILGVIICLHFFSRKKYRLIPVSVFIGLLWLNNEIFMIIFLCFISLIYLYFSLNKMLESFLYVPRKNRVKEKNQVKIQKPILSIFNKEVTILWREKLLISIIVSSVILGASSGYLAEDEDAIDLPESIDVITSKIPDSTYAFLGVYVLTIYSSVFIALSLFLNEENTLWFLRNMPISSRTIVKGKMFSLLVPLFCSIPFVAYFAVFTGLDSLLFLVWFLVFSFLAGVIISFPLGAKYVGKKSDILLLYSVSIFIFVFVAAANGLYNFFIIFNFPLIPFYLLSIFLELIFLWISIEISSYIVQLRYTKLLRI